MMQYIKRVKKSDLESMLKQLYKEFACAEKENLDLTVFIDSVYVKIYDKVCDVEKFKARTLGAFGNRLSRLTLDNLQMVDKCYEEASKSGIIYIANAYEVID